MEPEELALDHQLNLVNNGDAMEIDPGVELVTSDHSTIHLRPRASSRDCHQLLI